MFGLKKKLKLDVEISDNWRFRAEGAEDLVVALFSGWLGELTASHESVPAKEKPPVGFTSSRTRSLESETDLVEDDPDDEDDED